MEVIKDLMKNGVMAAINQVIDYETATVVARNMGFQPQEETAAEEALERAVIEEEDPGGKFSRGQQQTIDAFRQTLRNREAGRSSDHDLEQLSKEIRFTYERGHATPLLSVDLPARPEDPNAEVEKVIIRFHFTIKNLW